jgi:flagellar biosynthesis/type III secretory pathway protein FliH
MEDMGPYFRELMSDEINAAFQEGEQLGISKGEKTGFSKGEKTGFSKGEKTGFSKGEKTGFSKGEKTGFIKGELHTKRTIAKNLWDNEVAVDTIAKSLSVSEAQVEEWIKSELN